MTTLLALYRRPEGGPDALAEFERRYAAEHLPLVAETPGLRSTRVQRVSEALGGETDLVLITAMEFDDRAAMDAGLASDAMRAAGRNLREIAPGLATFLVSGGAQMTSGEITPSEVGGRLTLQACRRPRESRIHRGRRLHGYYFEDSYVRRHQDRARTSDRLRPSGRPQRPRTPEYRLPPPSEQHCYRDARLSLC